MDSGQPFTSMPKKNVYRHKTLLYIWWEQKGVLVLRAHAFPNETVTADRYQIAIMPIE